jgi:hypothetical protein
MAWPAGRRYTPSRWSPIRFRPAACGRDDPRGERGPTVRPGAEAQADTAPRVQGTGQMPHSPAPGGSSLARTGPGILSVMPTQRSGRRVLAVKMGMSAIFDLTGATIFRVVRQVLPEPPPPGSRPDPFRSAMDTIMAAHREVAVRARDKSGVTLPA